MKENGCNAEVYDDNNKPQGCSNEKVLVEKCELLTIEEAAKLLFNNCHDITDCEEVWPILFGALGKCLGKKIKF